MKINENRQKDAAKLAKMEDHKKKVVRWGGGGHCQGGGGW